MAGTEHGPIAVSGSPEDDSLAGTAKEENVDRKLPDSISLEDTCTRACTRIDGIVSVPFVP